MLIGKSLSFCVKDIILGKVKEEDVTCIVAGIKGKWLSDAYLDMINQYCEVYWVSNPSEARAIVNRMMLAGKIIQPRMLGLTAPFIRNGCWEKDLPLSEVIIQCEREKEVIL